jgi:tetratricopeptide (TPR) repeat protein
MREAFALADKAQMRAALEKLAEDADIERQPVRTLTRFASRFVELDATHRAVALLRQVRRRHPGDLWANHDLAIGLCFTKPPQLEEAVRWYSAAVALRPDSAGLRLNLGFALKEQGKLDEAIAEYREALRLKPEYAEAQESLGVALGKQGKQHEAIASFREAIRLKPEYAQAHHSLGVALWAQGKQDEAIAQFREVLRLKPDDALGHRSLGFALEKYGNLEEAVAEYRAALRIQPADPCARSNLAWLFATSMDPKWRRPAEALELAVKAVALPPEHADHWGTLGVARYQNGQWRESITTLTKAIELGLAGEDKATAWLFLAMARWQLDEKDRAREWHDKATTWMKDNKPNDELTRFRAEADALMAEHVPEPKSKAQVPAPAPKGGASSK